MQTRFPEGQLRAIGQAGWYVQGMARGRAKGLRQRSPGFGGFPPALLEFLKELSSHNHRDWFESNRERYQQDVLEPALDFIRTMAPRLKSISPYFLAEPRKSGGSLFRIYRDVRFSADKSPYKTHVGIQFPHVEGRLRKTRMPGFYVHVSVRDPFLGVGLWHPDSASLKKVRRAIDADPSGWLKGRDYIPFRSLFQLAGERLKNPPRGYRADHPLVEDLKRKDFIAVHPLEPQSLLAPDFPGQVSRAFASAGPWMSVLCRALGIPY